MDLARKNMLLMALFPYAEKGHRTALRNLADSKGIDWYASTISQDLHDLLGSIIRHKCTHYDECVKQVGQDKARFFVQGEITRMMREFKGKL